MNLYDYQQKALLKLEKQNGILVMDDVGMGKTLSACYAAYWLLKKKIVNKVIFVIPANLINTNQFKNELEKYVRSQKASLDENIYIFYSYNKFYTKSFDPSDFKKCLFVVDEADIMTNAFNEFNKKKGKYDLWAWKITWAAYHSYKTLLLSATPFRNRLSDFLSYYISLSKPKNINFKNPFYESKIMRNIIKKHPEFMLKNVFEEDIHVIYQKLYPYIIYKAHLKGLFPTIKYIKKKTNENTFEACNYFLDQVDNLITIDVDFSEEKYIYKKDESFSKTIYIEQKTLYNLIKKNKAYQKFLKINLQDLETEIDNSKFGFLQKVNVLRAQAISADLLNKCSNIILANNEYPVLIYSFFLSQGLDEIIKTFSKARIEPYDSNKSTKKKLYAVITGKTKNIERVNIIDFYNKGKIDVLVVSSAVNIGTNLTIKTKQVHILSLDWNVKSIIQTIGRVMRRNTHTVHVFIYKCMSDGNVMFNKFKNPKSKNYTDLPNIELTRRKAIIQTKFMEKITKSKKDRSCENVKIIKNEIL